MFNIFLVDCNKNGNIRIRHYALYIFYYSSASYRCIDYFKNFKEPAKGKKKITQIARYGTVLIACLQGYGVSVGLALE